jgi:PTS system ascorbate-specific IIB component
VDISTATSMYADVIVTNQELAQTLANHSAKIVIVHNYFDINEIRDSLEANLL